MAGAEEGDDLRHVDRLRIGRERLSQVGVEVKVDEVHKGVGIHVIGLAHLAYRVVAHPEGDPETRDEGEDVVVLAQQVSHPRVGCVVSPIGHTW